MNCGLGPSLEPVLASREQNLTLALYPNPLPWGYRLLVLANNVMSKLFSSQEAFVGKRGHGSRVQSLGQKVGEMAG